MPSVQQTAAFSRVAPVANALGAVGGGDVEARHRLLARSESSRTMRYIAGCSASVTGRACIARSASLSEFQ